MCIPECGVWTITAGNTVTVVLLLGSAFGVIVNTAVLLMTIIQHKRM